MNVRPIWNFSLELFRVGRLEKQSAKKNVFQTQLTTKLLIRIIVFKKKPVSFFISCETGLVVFSSPEPNVFLSRRRLYTRNLRRRFRLRKKTNKQKTLGSGDENGLVGFLLQKYFKIADKYIAIGLFYNNGDLNFRVLQRLHNNETTIYNTC